jgi:hypothetical protein
MLKRAQYSRSIFAAVGILILAAVVLIVDLNGISLWADEGWTIAATAEPNPAAVVEEWVLDDVHPPLYFVLLNIWRQFTGDTIFEMRYFAVLVTLVAVAAMYRLGAALFSVQAGLLAAFLFAVHDLVTVLTQEVRHYSLQQTLTVLTMWLYWRFWQHPTRNRGIAFALAGVALLYTHYWGGFVLLALGVHALITRLQVLRPYILANIGIAALYLPWVPAIYHQITIERPGGLPHALDNSWVVYETLANQLTGVPEWFWIVLAVGGVAGSIRGTQWRAWLPSAATGMLTLVVVLTIGLSLLINTQYPTLSFRSLAVVVPALMVLAAHTLAQFHLRELVVVMAFVVVHSLAITGAAPVERPPWPGLAEFLDERSTSADAVLLEMDTDDLPLMYYLERDNLAAATLSTETIRLHSPERYRERLADTLVTQDGVWLAKFGFFAYDPRPEITAHGFVQSAPPIRDFGRYADGRPIELYRFDRPAEEPLVSFGDTLQLMRESVAVDEEMVTLNLLWLPRQTPEWNYTISTFLLDANGRPTGPPSDSYPFNGRSPTLDWEAGNFYFDTHQHAIRDLPAGAYQVGVKVYYFLDPAFTRLEIAPASDCSDEPDCEFVIIDSITVN